MPDEKRPARTAAELIKRLKPIRDPAIHEMLQALPRSSDDCKCALCRKRRKQEAEDG